MVLAPLKMSQFSYRYNNCFWSFGTAFFNNYPDLENYFFVFCRMNRECLRKKQRKQNICLR